MSIKESKSLQFNGILWNVSYLGETVILLECAKDTSIEEVHHSSHAIVKALEDNLLDIVPAYNSIAVFTSMSIQEFIQTLKEVTLEGIDSISEQNIIELPICYEFGMDLGRVAKHAGLSEKQVINEHLNGVYHSLFIGFTPGFIYAGGLNEKLSCPRLDSPRKKVPPGSVGIAGNQTGIYSLESPGGWNIIGRTPIKLFDMEKHPPMKVDVGTKYRFKRIDKDQFENWEASL